MPFRLLVFVCLLSAVASAAAVDPVREKQAKSLESAGRLEDAAREYQALLLSSPENESLHMALASIRFRQGKFDAAASQYQDALAIHPKNAAAMAGLARCWDAQGQSAKAKQQWKNVAAEPSASADLKKEAQKRMSGQAAEVPGSAKASAVSTQAKPAMASVARETKAASDKYHYDTPEFNKALQDYQAGRWKESLAGWRKVLAAEPGNPGAYYYAGVCRYNLGESDKAEYNLKRSFAFPDKGFNANYYLGRISEKQKQVTAAAQYYKAYLEKTTSADGREEVRKRLVALGVDLTNLAVNASGGIIRKTNNDGSDMILKDGEKGAGTAPVVNAPAKLSVSEVAPGVRFAIQDSTGTGSAGLRKARDASHSGHWNQAITLLKDVRLQYPSTPNDLAAAYDLVALHSHLGLDDNAHALAEALLKGNPPEPYRTGTRFLLARTLARLGQYESAGRILDSVASDRGLGPDAGERSMLASDIGRMARNGKDAPALLEQTLAQEASPAERQQIRLRLADAYVAIGNRPLAIRTLRDALDSCGNDAALCRKAGYGVADLQYKEQNYPLALETYQKVTANWPDTTDSPWGLYQIGNILRANGDLEAAAQAYGKVVSQHPSSYWAEQAQWRRDDLVWRQKNANLLGSRP